MKDCKSIIVVICSIIFILVSLDKVYAAPNDVLIDEGFTTRNMINEDRTNAIVDTSSGEVRLPEVRGGDSLAVNNLGLLAITQNGVEFFNYDGNQYINNSYLSHSQTNPIAAALSPTSYEHYILDAEGYLTTYLFENGQLFTDPGYRLSGFSSALSVARSKESLFVLDNRSIRVFKDTGVEFIEVPQLELNLTIDNPIQIAVMGEDLVVLDEYENVHYYSFRNSLYERDPSFDIIGVGIGIDAKDGTLFAFNNNQVTPYHFTGDQLIRNEYISFTHDGATAVAGLEEDYTIFVRDETGVTAYYFDGSMLIPHRVTNYLTTMYKGYLSPRILQTNFYSWIDETKRIYVELVQELPTGTEINVEVSADGVLFKPVDQSGIVEFDEPISTLTIRAELLTSIPAHTPKLYHVRVIDKSLNIEYLEVTRIVRDPGGNPPLPTQEPVNVTGGYNIDMEVYAPGAYQVWIVFSNGEYRYMAEVAEELFALTHYFPEDQEGAIDAHIFASDDSGAEVDLLLPAHFLIVDNIMNNITIYDLK